MRGQGTFWRRYGEVVRSSQAGFFQDVARRAHRARLLGLKRLRVRPAVTPCPRVATKTAIGRSTNEFSRAVAKRGGSVGGCRGTITIREDHENRSSRAVDGGCPTQTLW